MGTCIGIFAMFGETRQNISCFASINGTSKLQGYTCNLLIKAGILETNLNRKIELEFWRKLLF
jgi:hypothetical protein